MKKTGPEVNVYGTIGELSLDAARSIVECAADVIAEKRSATIVLSGGRTPLPVYRAFASDELKGLMDWKKVHLFWGDERCVPPDHQDSNYWTAFRAFIGPLNIPVGNVHRIRGESGEAAAVEYEREIKSHFGLSPGEVPEFDIMILGMGPDGHTASIFPGSTAVREKKRLVAVVHVEELKKERITLTPPVITAARNTFVLATGADKAEVLRKVLKGRYSPGKLPTQLTRKSRGQVVWFVDSEAAQGL